MSRVRAGGERAFTMVEVLVAVVIVVILVAGIFYSMTSSGRSQQRSLVRQKMTSVADSVTQKLRESHDWLDANPGCKTGECMLSDQFQPAQKAGEPVFKVTVVVTPVDSMGDGKGDEDADGIRPDFYSVRVMVELDPSQKAQYGDVAPFEQVTTVDAVSIGKPTGTLEIQSCTVVDQIDERMSTAGCGATASDKRMAKQPEPCSANPSLDIVDYRFQYVPSFVYALGCNGAYDSASSTGAKYVSSTLHAENTVAYSITRVNDDGKGAPFRTITMAEKTTDDQVRTFTGLLPGVYRITITSVSAGKELWAQRSVPENLMVTVQPNRKVSAMLLTRPKQAAGHYRAHFSRTVYFYELDTETKTVVTRIPAFDVVFEVRTKYRYLVANGPFKKTWDGPSFSGTLAMEAKPYGRTAIPSPSNSGQRWKQVIWHPRDDPAGGWIQFDGLATGLHSLPEQVVTGAKDIPGPDGSFGTRTHDCRHDCGANFGWIGSQGSALGEPNGTVAFFDGKDGECYISSDVKEIPIANMTLLWGSQKPDRCDRDLDYVNHRTGRKFKLKDFFPDKNGKGGSRLVLSVQQTSGCASGCYEENTNSDDGELQQDPGDGFLNNKQSDPPTPSVKCECKSSTKKKEKEPVAKKTEDEPAQVKVCETIITNDPGAFPPTSGTPVGRTRVTDCWLEEDGKRVPGSETHTTG